MSLKTIFQPMADVLTPASQGVAQIDHMEVSEFESSMSSIRGDYCRPGTYARLLINGGTWMSDTLMEQSSNYDVVLNARGHVLIAGLGIGMVLLPILRKPTVTQVTVIELYPDVRDLVVPQLQKVLTAEEFAKLTVIIGDIETWRPEKRGRQFDVIYFDIWKDICGDSGEQMKRLRKTFARYLKAGGWAASWMQDRVKRSASGGFRRGGWY